jgi:hypothetical protein
MKTFDEVIQFRVTGLGMPWLRSILTKHLLHFFEGLAAGLRVGEEHLDRGSDAENAEYGG